jgi:hypothetical protein
MDRGSWNAGEVNQIPNKRQWIMLKGIKNRLINKNRRWFLGGQHEWKSIASDVDPWLWQSRQLHPPQVQQ